MESIDHINVIANHNFDGIVEGNITHFFGKCPECAKKFNSKSS
jgi:Fur family peroxide stress response transcriptional regulator